VTKPAVTILPKPTSAKPVKIPAVVPTISKLSTNPAKTLPAALPPGEPLQNTAPSVIPPVAKDSLAYEKEVYNHIHTVNGARLTEIESSLEINRFQAVDALRSLIKKGLITQRDRVYLAQEPAQV
jgi:hypothetical protein